VGRNETTLEDPEQPAQPARWVPTLRLLFSDGRIVERPAIELRDGEIVVGRAAPPTGITIDDPRVSRTHARLTVDARERTVVLFNEGRRTDVNGVEIARASLDDGDVIAMGRSLALLRWEHRPLPPDSPIAGMIGGAPSMRRVRSLVTTLAPTTAVVTVQGDTGTGKEQVARALHDLSGRSGAFVPVNCSAIPETLAESQLFGHVAGAFTGARTASEGLFRAASEGTIFLDEIGELSPAIQAKLLRVLEAGTVTPLGAVREVPHTARVVAATHRDLAEDVQAGRFRRDLYARITDFVVVLPMLRDRREDVLPLLRHAYGAVLPPLDLALASALVLHSWPFNVRELVRLATHLRIRGAGASVLTLEHAEDALERARRFEPPSVELQGVELRGVEPARGPEEEDKSAGPPSREVLEELLWRHGGVVSEVARAAGRSRKQVYRWLHNYGLDPDAYRR
jgi:DNA-binding NtrC family response regulator